MSRRVAEDNDAWFDGERAAVGDHHVVDKEVGAVDQRPGAAHFAANLGDRRDDAMRVADGLEGVARVDCQVDLVDD